MKVPLRIYILLFDGFVFVLRVVLRLLNDEGLSGFFLLKETWPGSGPDYYN